MEKNLFIHLQQEVPAELSGHRLDQVLAHLFPQYSRSLLQSWIKQGWVQLNGKIVEKMSLKVEGDQTISVQAEIKPQVSWQAQKIPLEILFEDEFILVVNKPAGLIVHPGAGNPDHTLVNALLHHAPSLDKVPRAGIIHRLDKDTSGLLIVAKTLEAHQALVQAMKKREIKREYLGLVKGVLLTGGTIQAPLGRHPTQRTRMAVVPIGQPAITHYRILEKFIAHTFLQIELETGRTHQIRVHMAHIRHPLVGDPVYGKQLAPLGKISDKARSTLQQFKRQALHAFRLSFKHPIQQEPMQFETPMPADLANLVQALREDK